MGKRHSDRLWIGETCGDCHVLIGKRHLSGCDIERCGHCGGQRLTCGCKAENKAADATWTGYWPDVDVRALTSGRRVRKVKKSAKKRFQGGERYRALDEDGRTRTHVAKKGDRRPGRWMQSAFATHKRGSLHRYLHVPIGQRIPLGKLVAAERRLARGHARAIGAKRRKLLSRLREVRLAMTARRIAGRRAA